MEARSNKKRKNMMTGNKEVRKGEERERMRQIIEEDKQEINQEAE